MSMKIKLQTLMDATIVLKSIIDERRPLPQKGKYRVARMHAKLLPDFTIINQQRDDMIKAYNYPQMMRVPMTEEEIAAVPEGEVCNGFKLVDTGEFTVPPSEMAEFTKKMEELLGQEIEVDVEPIPLEQLDLGDNVDGSIDAIEIIAMKELVQ